MAYDPRGAPITIEVGPPHQPVHALVLPANPDEQLSIDLRVTLIQTRTGAYYDDFGIGIPTLTLSGTTAWQSAQGKWDGQYCSGPEAALHLHRDIVQWYFAHERAQQSPTGIAMTVVDEGTGNVWTVKPITQVQFSISQTLPTVTYYTLDLSVILDHLNGVPGPPPPDPIANTLGHGSHRTPHAQRGLTTHATAAQGERQHPDQIRTILSGETFWSMAQSVLPANATNAQIAAEVAAIEHANPHLNPYALPVGIRVKIPIP